MATLTKRKVKGHVYYWSFAVIKIRWLKSRPDKAFKAC